MNRFPLKFAVAGITLAGILAATALPNVAHAARATRSHPARLQMQGSCYTWRVHLQGNHNTATCVEAAPPSGDGAQPFIYRRDPCSGTDLHLYINAGQSGSNICFYGVGSVNLTDYSYYGVGTWNDIASSWSRGIWRGTFFSDINENGASMSFPYGMFNQYDFNSATPVTNDALSSLTISSHD